MNGAISLKGTGKATNWTATNWTATIWTAAAITLHIPGGASAADDNSIAGTMFATANSADVAEEYSDAATKYQTLILKLRSTDPGNPFILRAKARLARMYLLQSKFDEAEPLYFNLMMSDRTNLVRIPELMIDLDDLSDAYVRMAKVAHYRYESLKHCVELRKRINPHHPRLAGAYRDLSEYCTTCNNLKDAISWMLKALDLERNGPVSTTSDLIRDENYLAVLYMIQNQLDKAEQAAREGTSVLPKTANDKFLLTQVHCTLGSIYKKKGLHEKAAKEYDIALNGIDNTYPKAAEVRARILQFVKENDEGRRKAKKLNH
jgi:tetratricopeptide (TPR) repeat protein